MSQLLTDEELGLFCQIPLVKEIKFSNEELTLLRGIVHLKQYAKKDKLLLSADIETEFRFVKFGILRQYYFFKQNAINTQFALPNDIVCAYASYMFNSISGLYIEAVSKAATYTIERQQMDKLVMQSSGFLAFGKRIAAEIYLQKVLRERELLNYNGLERLRHFMEATPELFLALPQTYIASYLNITPETFSALKKKLK
jgi:CRP/FNR family transcriptional regulator, anaerobic regulatory protein